MGIPKFYRWMSERYPCLSQVISESEVSAAGWLLRIACTPRIAETKRRGASADPGAIARPA